MATLKDVARLAGVSPSLVSYVIKGQKQVRPETYDRIQSAIKELDYRPNLLASALKTNHSMTIGVIASDLENAFYWDVIRGIEASVGRYNYCAIVCCARNDGEIEEEYLRKLSSRNIDGLIVIGTGEIDYSRYLNMNVPVVWVDRHAGAEPFAVGTDNEHGGYIGGKYLISKGHEKIMFIANERVQVCEQRYKGFVRAMSESGLEQGILRGNVTSFRMDDSYAVIDRSIRDGVEFDAVFTSSDTLAIGVLKALYDHHIEVPGQVAVLGYDDIMFAKFSIPALSTVAQPKEQMGSYAVDQLISMIEKGTTGRKQLVLKTHIVERESA